MKLKKLTLAIASVMASSALVLSGCMLDDDDNTPATANNEMQVSFAEVSVPTENTQKNDIQVSPEVTIDGATSSIGYTKLMRTGEMDNGETFGLMKDLNDNAITFKDGSPHVCNGTYSKDGTAGSGLDFFSILQKNDKLYMVSQFECQVGAMYKAELDQDTNTGELSVKPNTLEFISQKDEFGGFVHCAGQTTPWNSHLGSEEYENNARSIEASAVDGLTGNKYYDDTAQFWGNDATKMSPYYYGWTPEVQINEDGSHDYMKHYSMGRFSHELAYVMPDERTVYLSDDGTNVGLFMFVADNAGDLSSGKLYAAKWNQTSAEGIGEASLEWIDLGHATNDQVRAMLDKDNDVTTNDAITFSQIFDAEDVQADGTCATSGFTAINTTVGSECLKLKDVNLDGTVDATDGALASRLETRRYAAMMGATTEFRKEEGITFNARDNKLYVAMSEVARGMENFAKYGTANDSYDFAGYNHIQLQHNSCGGVYELDVARDEAINSDYVAQNMKGLVAGTEKDYSNDPKLSENTCDVNGIANPDNVTFLEGSDILVIGEDTGMHENNMIWAYNTKEESLTRMFTTPLGAETTAPFWYKDVNGFGYMTAVTQHPDKTSELEGQSEAGVIGTFKFK